MVWPGSNNLSSHVKWALSSGACRPMLSFVDSPEFKAAESKAANENEANYIGKAEYRNPIAAARAMSTHTDDRTPAASITSDSFKTPNSLPTPPSHPNRSSSISSEPDSDLEYLAAYPATTHPSTPSAASSHHSHSLVDHRNNLESSQWVPGQDPVHIIESSSNPNTPEKKVISENDVSGLREEQTPQFRFTEAPVQDDFAPPRQELGSIFSEKILLLEQKINILTARLSLKGVSVETREIDEKIREVERRIEQFPGDDEDTCDPFNLSSSPQMITRTTPGLPFDINNDQFDSDYIGESCDAIIDGQMKATQLDTHNFDADSDNDDDNDDEEVEIVNCSHAENIEPKPDAVPGHAFNSLGDEESLYNNRLYDDSMIIATETLQAPTQFVTQAQMATQNAAATAAAAAVPATQINNNNPWSKEMMGILRVKFGLQTFRPNQAEAVNETLAGNDVVVLMPTGGGKSLCYQLPALVKGGATQGTTVVISPLISLMQDQVYHLKNRNIDAEMLNSRLTASERSEVFAKLNGEMLQLLYISPEMLSASTAMRNALQRLYMSNRLARIVIDEAHCVSAWGHDFRPEYMELTKVKNEFPTTPIMALTATANERVLLDIVGCLRSNPIVLKQSFNRRNLFYEVRPKTANTINDIVGVCKMYSGRSGIIYCHSKKSCEDTASKLRKMGIRADYYHAGMNQDDRAHVQQAWQKGECSVVCATIAFGMGIDKPDVRYVMHMTLPRNIEGYYQETGRAGRDGKFSQCILFYSYRDVQLLQKMIEQDSQLSAQVRDHHRTLLIRVMQYCENKTDCRRQQVLQYFNEDFNPQLCRQQCDNCRHTQHHGVINKDMSVEAKLVAEVVGQVAAQNITTQQVTDVLLGRRNQKSKTCGFDRMPWFGQLQPLGPLLVERLVHALVSERVIEEYTQYNHSRFPQSYIRLGPQAMKVMKGQMPFSLSMPRVPEPVTKTSIRKTKDPTSNTRHKRGGSRASDFRNSKRTRK